MTDLRDHDAPIWALTMAGIRSCPNSRSIATGPGTLRRAAPPGFNPHEAPLRLPAESHGLRHR
ncbi:MAG TPA: hypothetical protein VFQ62_20160, partial [Methylomirabilota bacterium]|nr:hypothetical protein [Methylomirabilota bacterium]